MDESDWNLVKSQFRAAMDMPPLEREPVLKVLIEKYPDARDMLEIMFTNYSQTEIRLQAPEELAQVRQASAPFSGLRLGSFVGHFQLKRELGQGGMGVVYLAEQFIPIHREVAVKVIRAETSGSRAIRLFEHERQSLAMMNHPAIATILEAGETQDGFPYLAMEYVDGEPIHKYCESHRLELSARIRLFLEAADGIRHAHQKGILHRDIKPTNILVKHQDGRHLPKIIDFGLARLLDAESGANPVSRVGLQGTPAYMSPEQVTGEGIDTRTDVYALSLVLYQLLTGSLPYEPSAVTVSEILRRVLMLSQKPFPRASHKVKSISGDDPIMKSIGLSKPELVKVLRTDLDWILEKGMNARLEERYDSVAALSDDLQRFLVGKPVEARPPNLAYRWHKTLMRHKMLSLAVAIVVLAILSGGSAITIGWRKALVANQLARTEAAKSNAINRFLQDMLGSVDPHNAGREVKVYQVLDQAAEKLETEFLDQAAVRVALWTVIGKTYHSLGEQQKSVALLEKAVNLGQKSLGFESLETLTAMVEWGEAISASESKEGQKQALAAYTEVLKQLDLQKNYDQPLAFQAHNNLATLYFHSNELERAVEHIRASYEGRLRVLGENHPKTLLSEGNMIFIMSYAGQREEAADLERSVLERKKRVMGEKHPSTLSAAEYLGQFNLGLGRIAEAEKLFLFRLDGAVEVFGRDHERVASAKVMLAKLRLVQQRFLEAEALCNDAQRILEKEGSSGYWRDLAVETRSEILSKLARYEEAENLLKEIQAANPLKGEPSGDWCLIHYRSLRNHSFLQGKNAVKVVPACEGLEGHFPHESGERHAQLGQIALDWDPLLAEHHLRKALTYLPVGRTLHDQTRLFLGRALLLQGRHKDAKEELEPLLIPVQKGEWPQNEGFFVAMEDYGEVLARLGIDPLPVWTTALARAKQIMDTRDGRPISLQAKMAKYLDEKGKREQARTWWAEAGERAEITLGVHHPLTQRLRAEAAKVR